VTKLILAVDTGNLRTAADLIRDTRDSVDVFKFGLQFWSVYGPAGVGLVSDDSPNIFLDLKLHDIPNSVGPAVTALLGLNPAMLTVHASGGAAMLCAARNSVDAALSGAKILAVTLLTSLGESDLEGNGVAERYCGRPEELAAEMAVRAVGCGAHGVVCAPSDARRVRERIGAGPIIVVPGVRPESGTAHDQVRIGTPAQAAAAGADYVVVGRPITRAASPREAAAEIKAMLAGASP
jgi:orotidine-5'-phosphate decarboxylase